MAATALTCVLWDFGNTIADEKFAARGPAGVDGWPAAWQRLRADELMTRWDRGEAQLADVAAWLGRELEREPAWVLEQLKLVCQRIEFFAGVMAMIRSIRLPQALVTVNPDAFKQIVVPYYELDDVFDAIVPSCEVGSVDKADVCDAALARLGVGSDRSRALLIDNLETSVSGWRARGGLAYQFVSEARLEEDRSREPLSLLTHA